MKDHSDALDSMFNCQSSWQNVTKLAVSGGNDGSSPCHYCDDDDDDGDKSDSML